MPPPLPLESIPTAWEHRSSPCPGLTSCFVTPHWGAVIQKLSFILKTKAYTDGDIADVVIHHFAYFPTSFYNQPKAGYKCTQSVF